MLGDSVTCMLYGNCIETMRVVTVLDMHKPPFVYAYRIGRAQLKKELQSERDKTLR